MKRLCSAVALQVWLLVAVVPAMAQLATQGHDPLAGSQVFGAKGCSKCHAVNGVGGKVGPDLARITRPRSFYDLATAMWNHLPRMTERMQQLGIARPNLSNVEAGDLVAFLYTLNYFDPPGNRDTGRRLFSEKRCVVCHQINGTGGVVGPNLDAVGRAGAVAVTAAMWNHGPTMMATMRAKGIERPTFTGAELRDLLAYLTPADTAAAGPVYALRGRIEPGRALFIEKRCIECHSVGGQGGRVGPDLVERGVHRSLIEFAAAMWNKAPKMLAAMQPLGIVVPHLEPDEMADIIGYLYSVRYFAGGGTVSRGWSVASDKGCLRCHAVSGERGKPASDLTQARGLDSPPAVLAALWNHAIVTATTPSGEKTPWPELRAEQMADLVSLLGSLGRRR
jgi:mono/diheme cytochrome c family protein